MWSVRRASAGTLEFHRFRAEGKRPPSRGAARSGGPIREYGPTTGLLGGGQSHAGACPDLSASRQMVTNFTCPGEGFLTTCQQKCLPMEHGMAGRYRLVRAVGVSVLRRDPAAWSTRRAVAAIREAGWGRLVNTARAYRDWTVWPQSRLWQRCSSPRQRHSWPRAHPRRRLPRSARPNIFLRASMA